MAKGRVLKAIKSEQNPEFFELGNNSQGAVSILNERDVRHLQAYILGFGIGEA